MNPTPGSYKLIHDGILALSKVEAAGLRIDVKYLDEAILSLEKKIAEAQDKLREDDIFTLWKKKFGARTNLGSHEQLGKVVFGEMGYSSNGETATGRHKTDEKSFAGIKLPFLRQYFQLEKWKKAKITYLEGIRKEVVGEYLHPSFNLHTVQTHRSSADSPNFQNIPVRNKEVGELVRKCFIPREGNVLAEVDYSAIEVRIAACYHKDPVMIEYINDPSKDMHRDQAMQCFLLEKEWVSKETRYAAKNLFVFPQFYGDYYVHCAKNLWDAIRQLKLQLPDGTSLKKHLARKGIKRLGACDGSGPPEPGTFEAHIRSVEKDFWERRFQVYAVWKRQWYDDYCQRGWFPFLTGFVGKGYYRKNEVINYPVQGCLAGNSQVITRQGWIFIKDLVGVETEIWTGFVWARAVGLDRGVCQRAVIQMDSGLSIRCDTRHKLKNAQDEWVDFSDLHPRDWAALPKNGAVLEASEEMTWSFVFGFIIGDGCISSKRRDCLTIVAGDKKRTILEKIKEFLIQEGYQDEEYRGVHWDIIPATAIRKEKYKLSIGSKRFALFLKSKGFVFGWTSHTKRVPASIWTASLQEQRDFMEGLWLSDGCREGASLRTLHMANRPLLKEVQKLSSALGFDSILKGIHLRFHWKEFNAKSPRKYPAEAITRQVRSVRRENYDNQCEYITDHRAFSQAKKGVNPSQYVAERLLSRNCKDPLIYRYDRIRSIKVLNKEETTYTMSVDDALHQFVADGVVHKNTAFHCLLWSLTELQREIEQRRMRTKIVGQIHDSLLADVPEDEIQDWLNLSREVMTKRIGKHWEWLNIPLEIEAELTPVNGSWDEKKSWVNKDGGWIPRP